MSKKVVLFLSKVNNDAGEKRYSCPDGTEVSGTQTNEAPVKYLLRAHRDIEEILCVVTPEARNSAWEWFEGEVRDMAPHVRLTPISYEMGTEDFTDGPLRRILEHTQAGDEIFLETTGGLRDNVMYLLLLSRVLSYTGVRTSGAVYTNFNDARIQDISNVVGIFDLVGGMQELTGFGSTRTLRAYYGTPAGDARIEALLAAVEGLRDTIMLCRTEQLDGRVAEFETAMSAATECDDLLLRQLLPAFRKKYGKKLTIVGVIKWCVESEMLQQALTIYKERIPAYLLREREDLLSLESDAKMVGGKLYLTSEEQRFMNGIYSMGRSQVNYDNFKDDEQPDLIYFALRNFSNLIMDSDFHRNCSLPKLQTIFYDYLYIRLLRNMVNHAQEAVTPSAVKLEDFLVAYGYPRCGELTANELKTVLLNALEHLRKEK